MKIYMFLADGFEETEAIAPLDLVLRAGADIKTVSVNGKDTVCGAHNINVKADLLLENTDLSDCDGLILPGGGLGTENLYASEQVKSAVKQAYDAGKLVCAICAAPTVLGRMGLLKDKTATCYPGMEDMLYCKTLSDTPAVRDGNIITARGMGVSYDFGLEIVSYLYGKDKANELKKTTCGK